MALLLTLIVYFSISFRLFPVFYCETLDDCKEYLRADVSVECNTAKQRALLVSLV